MALSLPTAASLAEAVHEIIRDNLAQKQQLPWFIVATGGGNAPDLVGACTRLIMNPENLPYLESILVKRPNLLTLEDFVSRHGVSWGFARNVVEEAHARSIRFDQVVGHQRWK